jgi:hypothetical protein
MAMAAITGLPDGVVGIRGTGEITEDDYEHVLIPAVEAALADHDKIRLLYVLGPGFEGMEGDAMWEDTKVGMHHLFSFERMACVTDVEWMRRGIVAFGFLMPGKVKAFGLAEEDAARAFIAEGLA